MPDSSARFEIVLTPDPLLRSLLPVLALLAAATGLVLILTLHIPAVLRLLLATCWLALEARSYRDLRAGAARVAGLRLSALDDVSAVSGAGQVAPVKLLPGSFVLRRMAVLRLRFDDGREYVEWLRGDPAIDPDWQRLRLVFGLGRRLLGHKRGS